MDKKNKKVISFPQPHLFQNLTDTEVKFRERLPLLLIQNPSILPFLNFDTIQDIELLPESESSVVYKISYKDKEAEIIKITSSYEEIVVEISFLYHWTQLNIRTPKIKSFHSFEDDGLRFGIIHMNFIAGKNLRESLKEMSDTEKEVKYEEMGSILATMHKSRGKGYGRPFIKDGNTTEGEFSSFKEWSESKDFHNAFVYCLKNAIFENSFTEEYNKSLKIIDNYFIDNSPSLLHGDYRAGNFLLSNKDKHLVLIDPSPLVGHPYFDVAYYLILNNAYSENNNDEFFFRGYTKEKPVRKKELLSSIIIEGTRMCSFWHKKSDTDAFLKMQSIVIKACKELKNNGDVKSIFTWI